MFSELKAYFQDMSVYKKIICVLCVFLSGYDLLAATVIRINYWVHYPMNLLIAALVICLTSMEKRGKVSIGYICLFVFSDVLMNVSPPTQRNTAKSLHAKFAFSTLPAKFLSVYSLTSSEDVTFPYQRISCPSFVMYP